MMAIEKDYSFYPGLYTFKFSWRKWWRTQQLKAQLKHEREQLATLPDHLLRDIGIHPADAQRESLRRDIPESRIE